jgi:3-oxoadipate enol-lactonase
LSFRYHTYALDLRGHGCSGRRSGAYRVADYAADVVQLLRERGDQPAILVGHSLGGDVGVQVAAEAPTLTYAVILDEPGLYVMAEGRLAAHPIYKRLQTLHDLLGMERSMEEIIFRVGEQLSGVALANGEPV